MHLCIGYTPVVNRADRRKLETRERILSAAFELFVRQGTNETTIEEICERADVATRTFFNHFPTRQDMLRALADRRLGNLHDVVLDGSSQPIDTRLISLFDQISTTLVDSGDAYREMLGAMVNATGYAVTRGSSLHETFVELVKDGIARGEVSAGADPQILADVIVGALSGAIVNWTADRTYAFTTNMHELGTALATLLTARPSAKKTPARSPSRNARRTTER